MAESELAVASEMTGQEVRGWLGEGGVGCRKEREAEKEPAADEALLMR